MLPNKNQLHLMFYNLSIAMKDSWRSRVTLLTTSTVFAGICLLLLMLNGLKNGLVEQLREDITKDPFATSGTWHATSHDQALDLSGEAQLLDQLPPGAVIIPEITKLVTISTGSSRVEQVSLQATVPGDPFLGTYGAAISGETSSELIVSPAVAEELGVSIDDLAKGSCQATVSLSRGTSGESVTANLQVTIASVVGSQASRSKIAWLSRHYMDELEHFTQGEAVVEHGWPGLPVAGTLGCHGYLVFSKQAYTADDMHRLHLRGFEATEIPKHTGETSEAPWRDLYGLLKPHEFFVYFVKSEAQNSSFDHYVTGDVSELESITPTDDVALYWSIPTHVVIDDTPHLMLGISGSLRWLRPYFRDLKTRLPYSDMQSVMLPFSEGVADVWLALSGGARLSLKRMETPETFSDQPLQLVATADDFATHLESLLMQQAASWPNLLGRCHLLEWWSNSRLRSSFEWIDAQARTRKPSIAIVSPSLLSAVHRLGQGTLEFDSANGSFEHVSSPNFYYSGRFFARVLEDVPVIDDHLQTLGYNTVSSRLRIVEMQSYANTLDLLVLILQVIAVALGMVTSSVLFMDVTRRRQTAVAILRIMGMSSGGIFLFIFARAVVIAAVGWATASGFAFLISRALPLLTHAECLITISDYAFVLCGALICSSLGCVFHAYAATQLDPLPAINAGKLQ